MRTLLIVAAALTGMTTAGAASAQTVSRMGGGTWNRGTPPMTRPTMPRPVTPGGGHWRGGGNWNQNSGWRGGSWQVGHRAPGGWNAYRRPNRGWQLPSYWRSPSYRFNYSHFGLTAPQNGYYWTRYYDDALLVDRNWRVYDSMSGLDWSAWDGAYGSGYGYPSAGYAVAPSAPGYYDGPRYDDDCEPRRRSGVGGAIVGGAIGAGTGALIAKKGDKLAGGLIGGGLGALAGQAIDRNGRRGDDCDYPVHYDGGYQHGGGYQHQGSGYGYGDSYAYADGGYAYAQAAPPVVYAQPQEYYIQPSYDYSYGYMPGVSATATFEWDAPQTVTTTTVTEEYVTVPAKRKVWRKPVRKWKPAKKKVVCCQCATVCR